MDKIKNTKMPVFTILKVLILSYVVTAVMLLLLAALLFKLELSEGIVDGGIVFTYELSCFLGGFVMGKLQKTRKFLWGLAIGCMYYIVLLAVSLIMKQEGSQVTGDLLTSMALCIGSGMLGGMLS